MDQLCSLALLVCLVLLGVTHALRDPHRKWHARVEMEGRSALLSRGVLESLYAVVVPVGLACKRLGLTPNMITGASVLLALAAGALFAAGHLGLGSLVGVIALGCDALDGFVARHSGSASNAGEVIDAAADRYVEFSLFAGLALHLRLEPMALLICLAALAGSFMLSYSTAKAEALAIVPPRGSMRRTERCVLLIAGAVLTPLSSGLGLSTRWAEAPLLVALLWLAVGSNVSALARFAYVARQLRLRDVQRSDEPHARVENLPQSCAER
jgi:CDP-diacylglycerol--glycerol-3-phosphate 3-phosphatidyltransferase